MSTIRYHDGPIDESIHLADGSHRALPPADFPGDGQAWTVRRDEHVAEHVKEALKANADLKGDQLLRDLADQASQKTQGTVFLIEKTMRNGIPTYTFRGLDGPLDRDDAVRGLLKILREPRGL